MGKIILEVEDKDLLQFGEEKIREEIEHTFKWIKIKWLLKSISRGLSSLKVDYEKEVDKIKTGAWRKYKKELPL